MLPLRIFIASRLCFLENFKFVKLSLVSLLKKGISLEMFVCLGAKMPLYTNFIPDNIIINPIPFQKIIFFTYLQRTRHSNSFTYYALCQSSLYIFLLLKVKSFLIIFLAALKRAILRVSLSYDTK